MRSRFSTTAEVVRQADTETLRRDVKQLHTESRGIRSASQDCCPSSTHGAMASG